MRLSASLLFASAAYTPLSWDEAYPQAAKLVSQMTMEEKYSMMSGIGWTNWVLDKWWYVGNLPAVERLGIPSVNMQDAAGGFRTYWDEIIGTVTCWPSLLSMAATWDVDTMHEFSVALGQEFAGKGANTILGPSINVHRVARNGRNFEYLSGDDPFLGGKLAEQYVSGVQSQGVMTVMKHFVFNNQETNRNSEDSLVEDQAAWELYYPPFQAAVDAGVSGTMCSYNKEDGDYSCSNNRRLNEDLKGKMGFRGFVQSDWGATHATSVTSGLDMDMPMVTDPLFQPEALSQVPEKSIDEAVTRTLAAMVRMGVMNSTKCTPPACNDYFVKDVRGDHAAVALKAAKESVVLLQNEGGVLPIGAGVGSIAVIGSPAVATAYNPTHGAWDQGDYYSGGGSGHVVASDPVSPLAGLKARAKTAGIEVIESTSDDIYAAQQAAAKADIAIVVAGTTSGESQDRPNLILDNNADQLIAAVASTAKKTVVLTMIPGVVVMPWRTQVDAIATLFLGGQETGTAFAAVLFGDHGPTGRLPVMLPETEADTIDTTSDSEVTYSEGMQTSYRSPNFKAAFPFGHGLAYTNFSFSAPSAASCAQGVRVSTTITNTGAAPGVAVPQAYVEFPKAANHPAPLLKGFKKTKVLQPGASEKVTFELGDRELSYWDKDWVKTGSAVVHVGASSADFRGKVTVTTAADLVVV